MPQRLIAYGGTVILLLLLVVLVRRRLVGLYPWFFTHVVGVFATSLIQVFAPQWFTWQFWTAKELVLGALSLAIAVSLAREALRIFPTARTVAWVGIVLVGVGTAAAFIGTKPIEAAGSYARSGANVIFLLALANSSVFTVVLLVVLFFNLPLERFSKAILVGFVAYLVVFQIALRVLQNVSSLAPLASLLDSLGYTSLIIFWLFEAWATPQAREAKSSPLSSPR